MDCTKVIELVEKFWHATVPNQRREVFKYLRTTVPPEHLTLFDGLVDNKRNGLQDSPNSKILVLIHGIHTDGSWQKQIQAQMKTVPNLQVHDLGYDVVTGIQLACPFRSGPINKVVRDIRIIKSEEPMAKIFVIAHSFGTYITSKILAEHPDISFEKIILCGSIIRRDFPWALYAKGMRKEAIVNDVGTRDIWPIVATITTLGYGSSGRRGFQNGSVTDRYFDYEHSDFFELKNNHAEKYWRPLIQDEQIVPSAWDEHKPKSSFMLLLASHPLIGRIPVFIIYLLLIPTLFTILWKGISKLIGML
ncbi:alpha/beta hydrolase [Pseudomonas sp. MM213]|uniref:alpha/beta fold hydrolase n=1 Tax=Pseudomonas sp. MM213 TaxID=2866807 RepID=UPI001CF21EEA|nr:alpha/beta fold hydrolase [Pseudomonas sp. MM213]UCP08571.1 alpha/beta hydrolase [Pseudomonas sp. MM213]